MRGVKGATLPGHLWRDEWTALSGPHSFNAGGKGGAVWRIPAALAEGAHTRPEREFPTSGSAGGESRPCGGDGARRVSPRRGDGSLLTQPEDVAGGHAPGV